MGVRSIESRPLHDDDDDDDPAVAITYDITAIFQPKVAYYRRAKDR